MANAITRVEMATAVKAAKMRFPVFSKSNMGVCPFSGLVNARDQAISEGVAGTIAVAMASAERATAKAAAKRELALRVIGGLLKGVLGWG